MKKITFLLTMLLAFTLSGQAQVAIGAGTNEAQNVPFEPYYGYSYGQSVYLASEINANGNITGLQWYFSGTSALGSNQELVIYMGHTSKTEFADDADFEDVANLTQVYAGGITVSGAGWVTITFDTPFAYNGTDNLMVAVEENMAGYNSSGDDFYNSSVTGNRSIYAYSDTVNIDPADPNAPEPTPDDYIGRGVAAYVPNIIFDGIQQACPTPTMLASDGTTTSTATFTWQVNGSETEWQVLVLPEGSQAPDSSTSGTTITTSGTHTATGLDPESIYQFYVRASCGGGLFSAWAGPITVKTLCLASPLPWSEDFESVATGADIFPSCWAYVNISNNWSISTTPTANSGVNSLRRTWGTDGWAFSPTVTLASGTSYTFSYYMRTNDTVVGYNIDVAAGAGQGVAAMTETLSSVTGYQGPSWTKFSYNFTPSVTGDYSFGIHVSANSAPNGINFDDFKIDLTPSCVEPTDVAVSGVTSSGATVTWTESVTVPANGYEYYVSTDNTAPDASSTANGSVTAGNVSANMTGLDPATVYYVWVRSVCSGSDSSEWSAMSSFKTACLPVGDFQENFDATTSGTLTDCWSNIVNATSIYAYVRVYDNTAGSEPNSVELYNSGDAAANLFLITPDLGTSAGDGTHRIKFKASGATGYSVVVGTMSDFTDPNTFTEVETINLTGNFADYNVSFTSPSTDHYVAFKHGLGGTYRTIKIDDVVWEPIPSAPPACVTDAVATPDDSCGNYATAFAWSAVDGADGYNITIGTTNGGNDILDNQDMGNVTSYSYEGNFNTTYYYTITAYNAFGPAVGCTSSSYMTNAAGCYCQSVPLSNDNSGITNIMIGATDYPVTDITYLDNTGTTVDLAQGINNNVSITFGTGYTYDTNIWIDFNNNFVFEPSEIVYTGVSTNANPTTLNASFIMPADAALGNHTMRIGTADSGQNPPNPCFGGDFGITVDFTANIVVANCTPPSITTATVVANCASNNYSVDVDVATLGNGTPAITDGTTTWPVTATGVITVGPFVNATTTTLTLLHGSEAICDIPLGNFTNACPPMNDECTDAIAIDVSAAYGEILVDGYNNAATASSGETAPVTCGGYSGGDVWYTLSVPPSGNVIIETLNSSENASGVDTVITVYSGECGALTQVGCDDDGAATGAYSKVTITGQTPGDTLHLRIYEYNNDNAGSFGITAYDESMLNSGSFDNAGFRAYPNPVKDILNLSYTQNITAVSVYNVLGQQVMTKAVNANQSQVDMSNLSAGTYLVKVNADNQVKTIKVVKQ